MPPQIHLTGADAVDTNTIPTFTGKKIIAKRGFFGTIRLTTKNEK
jgi:hypothetical protein